MKHFLNVLIEMSAYERLILFAGGCVLYVVCLLLYSVLTVFVKFLPWIVLGVIIYLVCKYYKEILSSFRK